MKKLGLFVSFLILAGAVQAEVIARWMLEGEPGNQATSVANAFVSDVVGALCGAEPDVLASWDFNGVTTQLVVTADINDPGLVLPEITRTIEWNGSEGYLDTFSMRNNQQANLTDAISATNYISWVIEPEAGKQVSIDQLFIRISAVNAGPPNEPRQIALFSSATGFEAGDALSTWSVPGVNISHTVDLVGVQALKGLAEPVEFRIVAWAAGDEFQNTGIGRAFESEPIGPSLIVSGLVQDEGDPLPEPDFCDPALTRTSSIGASGLANTFMMRDNQQTSLADAIDSGVYISWTLRPVNEHTLTLTSLFIRVSAQNSSGVNPPREVALYSSLTGWEAADALDEWQIDERGSHTIDLTAWSAFQDFDDAVEFRLIAWNAPDQWSPTGIGYDVHDGEDDLILYGLTESGEPGVPDAPALGTGSSKAEIVWSTEEGYLYTVLFTLDLAGEAEWTPVPDAENLPWDENTLTGLPHIDVPSIFYAVERVQE